MDAYRIVEFYPPLDGEVRSSFAAERERRVVLADMEARTGQNDERTLTGYAALYDTETRIGSYFREVIEPGAFRSAIARQDDVRALFNHDPNYVLGRTTAGTLVLSEDERGLRYTVTLPDTQAGRDLWTSVQRGDISQSSFAFSVDAEEWRDKQADMPLRVVKDVHLYDVSPVTYPAYNETSVSARSQAETLKADAQRAAEQAADDWQAQIATRQAEQDTVLLWYPPRRS